MGSRRANGPARWFSKYGPWPSTLAFPESRLRMQSLRPHPRPALPRGLRGSRTVPFEKLGSMKHELRRGHAQRCRELSWTQVTEAQVSPGGHKVGRVARPHKGRTPLLSHQPPLLEASQVNSQAPISQADAGQVGLRAPLAEGNSAATPHSPAWVPSVHAHSLASLLPTLSGSKYLPPQIPLTQAQMLPPRKPA